MTHDTIDGFSTRVVELGLDGGRADLEEAIRRRYARAFGAQIEHFHDQLIGLQDDAGAVLGVIGCTHGRVGNRLFVENYTDDPIEEVLSKQMGWCVSRRAVAEVGNLISEQGGMARHLLAAMIHWLAGQDTTWAVFAATRRVRLLIRRVGLQSRDLGAAEGSRLGTSKETWGTYYEGMPRVLAVNIPLALRMILKKAPELGGSLARAQDLGQTA